MYTEDYSVEYDLLLCIYWFIQTKLQIIEILAKINL